VKVISTMNCETGDVLAEDVFNNNGIVLVSKNTMISDFIKQKLIDYKIHHVKIYKPEEGRKDFNIFEKQYRGYVVLMSELLKGVAAGNSREIERVTLIITEQIYQNISDGDQIIQYLQSIGQYDDYTYTHCINVAFYALLIGYWTNLPKDKIYELISAALLHDIGKTQIPPEILNKNGKLDREEYEIIKKHSTLGYEAIKDIPSMKQEVKNAILMHHERMDGSGYPAGLSGDEICLYARIIAIADVYDAMTQNRVYHHKVSPFESFQMFLTEGVRLFHYPTLKLFLDRMAPLYIGANVQLSNGYTGEIVYIPPQDILSPILNINSEYIDLSKCTDLKVLQIV